MAKQKEYWRDAKEWSRLTMVKLAEKLEQCGWFKSLNAVIYYGSHSSTMTPDMAKAAFEQDERKRPKSFRIKYKITDAETGEAVTVAIAVRWCHEFDRYEVFVESPTVPKYYHDSNRYSWRSRVKPVGSKYMEGILERIQTAVVDAAPYAREDLKDVIKKAAAFRAAEKKLHDTIDDLGVTLKREGSDLSPSYVYSSSEEYAVKFRPEVDEDGEVFCITDVQATFTKDELKQFLTLVGGCGSAVAYRLIHGKGDSK